ncbi:MAG TPA: tetratricopeptide repeat protein, partial [Candidatus Polarisedimenticolia bacterium]|nr:tetratricopeptide repeat protein [Candidatus Polarisedimenticolia bacterium]
NAPLAKLTKTSLHSAFYVALALERTGEATKAAQAYRNILQKNPEEADRICARLESILSRDYQNLPLRLALVDLLLQAGKLPESLQHLEHSLEADAAAAAPEVASRLDAIASKHPGRTDVLWLLARARRAESKFPEMLLALGGLAQSGSHRSEIISLLEELTPRMDEHPALRLALADTYIAAGKPVLAVEAILLASERVGDDVTAKALEKVARVLPQHARTYLLLGDLDFKAGRGASGVQRYEKVLELSPEEGPILVPKLLSLLDAGTTPGPIAQALSRILLREGEPLKAATLLRYRLIKEPECAGEIVEQARDALRSAPAHGALGLALAEAHLAAGAPLEAIPVLESLAGGDAGHAREILRLLSTIARTSPEGAQAALPAYRKLASGENLPAATRFGLGEAALLSGALGEAVQAFKDLASIAPDRMNEVQEIFEGLLEKHPEAVEVRHILAGLYLDQRKFKLAAEELKKIRSLNPDLLAPILAKYREVLRESPSDIEIRLGLSSALVLSGQMEEVQILATETLRLRDDATTATLQLDLGDVALDKADITGAVKRYYNAYRKNTTLAESAASRLERLLDRHPSVPLASLALGKILPEAGRMEDAVARLLEAFRNDTRISEGVLTELDRIRAAFPAATQAAEARVEILSALGKDAAATEAIQNLLDSRPECARSMLPRLEAILARSPRLAPALLCVARAQRVLKETSLAAEACRSAYRMDPACAPEVIKLCSEIIAGDPTVAGPYLTMAEIYLADGEVPAAAEKLSQAAFRVEGANDEVLSLLESIVAKDSGTARVAFLAAEILSRAGRLPAATRAYRKALEREAGLVDPVLKGLNSVLESEPRLGEARLARAQALALRQEFDAAVLDLESGIRATPSILPDALNEARRLYPRRPASYRLVSLLSEMLLAAEKLHETVEFLDEALKRTWEPGERLILLVRLWRARLGLGETTEARQALREAEGIATDRNQLLARVHECILSHLRQEVGGLQVKTSTETPRPSDLKRLAEVLLDLGETAQAVSLTASDSSALATRDLLKIHSE